jgi:membrane fusion protein (multidrug efflux system)
MTKRMLIMLILVGILFGGIFGFKIFKARMIKKFMASKQQPPATVTALQAELQPWQPRLSAVGSLRALKGVDVTSEIAGVVRTVSFKSGESVEAGRVLVRLNADTDVALLHSLEAAADLARSTFERDKAQFSIQAVSQATLDNDAADLKIKEAKVAEQAAVVAKKTIRAPFAGRIGISTVNPGHYLNPGDAIVTLQALDPIYVDFFLPQQVLSRLKPGLKVELTTDSYPGRTFEGKISAVNPKVDPDTRNVQVEATLPNPGRELLPGMFASVTVETGEPRSYLTLPQTAVTYNPYGESIYIVEEKEPGTLTVRQTFVTLGDTRGDQVAVIKGVEEGDTVVTSGQLKLRNGSTVVIDNKVTPANEPAPAPVDQ